VISPRGALNLPAARFLQTKRFDPLPLLLDALAVSKFSFRKKTKIPKKLKNKNSQKVALRPADSSQQTQ
jgi:hypothetical protein